MLGMNGAALFWGGVMKLRTSVCTYSFNVLGSTAGVFAQGVGASGNIKGTIRDVSRAVMQNVCPGHNRHREGVRRTATTRTGLFGH
jgi:hypothetical protein